MSVANPPALLSSPKLPNGPVPTYFKDLPLINQTKAREYEKVLKQELRGWAQSPSRQQLCDKVLTQHREELNVAMEKVCAGVRNAAGVAGILLVCLSKPQSRLTSREK